MTSLTQGMLKSDRMHECQFLSTQKILHWFWIILAKKLRKVNIDLDMSVPPVAMKKRDGLEPIFVKFYNRDFNVMCRHVLVLSTIEQ